ncbi:MAG: glycosyl hydrolase family 28-related protein [Victivallales bacterium]|jgi:hypothetical protein
MRNWIFVSLLIFSPIFNLFAEQLPALNWEKRSDWLDPKTDITPTAKGDGIADDTDALQAALDKISNDSKTNKVVFLSKGTYRITKTLHINKTPQGAMVIGCGRDTRLVWDGEENGRMLESNGAGRHRWIGIVWDGKSKAGVGVDHRSESVYETRVRHEHEAFLGFKISGIRVGFEQKTASAEMLFFNLFFDKCEKGVSFLSWNDYDNFFSNCLFRDCGVGIYCEKGNYVVRCSNFERSRVADMISSTHSFSVRRTYSTGSEAFIKTLSNGRNSNLWMIDDCRIEQWKSAQGAIQLGFTGPTVLIDTVFTKAPGKTPPVRLTNTQSWDQGIIYSNCQSPDTNAVIDAGGPKGRVVEIPKGALAGSLPEKPIMFFSEQATIAGKVFDARRDFGAKGDGRADDTVAIQNAIDAAKKHQNNAIAYLPFGTYKITKPLVISGENYSFGGIGWSSVINYSGNGGPAIDVRDPQKIMLEQFRIEIPETAIEKVAKISQTSTGKGSSITYDGVWVGGSWRVGKPDMRGLEAVDLKKNDAVRLKHFDGSIRLTDCSAAEIYGDMHIDGKLLVEGTKPIENGFLGFWGRLCSGNDFDHEIRDNHSVIMTDFYVEQTSATLLATGGDVKRDKPGRITFHQAKSCWQDLKDPKRAAKSDGIFIKNYYGQISGFGCLYMYQIPSIITQEGDRPLDLVFGGNCFSTEAPVFKIGKSATVTFLENQLFLKNEKYLPNQIPDPKFKAVVNAFDHFREFGARDLEKNKVYR